LQIKFCCFRPKAAILHIAIFEFFKIEAAAILDFKRLKLLTVGTVKKVELRYHAKFRRNRSNRGENTAIFRSGPPY